MPPYLFWRDLFLELETNSAPEYVVIFDVIESVERSATFNKHLDSTFISNIETTMNK